MAEPDPEGSFICGLNISPESGPDPISLPTHLVADLCHQIKVDDHGDTLLCATPLALGSKVKGELGNDWGDDEDLFTFVLTTQPTVQITSGTDIVGILYDRYGHRLVVDGDQVDDSGFRIVKTLDPGQYFVRVAGKDGAEGDYTLDAKALAW